MIFNYDTHTIQLEPLPDGTYRATIEDRVYIVQAAALNNQGWLLTVDNQRFTAYTATEGTRRYVQVLGETAHTLSIPDTRNKRRRSGGTTGNAQLTAQMPGQVVDVYAADGDSVSAGQTLVVLEAMKMEIRLSAPYDAVVRRVLVKKGDVVEREQLLLELEASQRD